VATIRDFAAVSPNTKKMTDTQKGLPVFIHPAKLFLGAYEDSYTLME
jgi:hypothetical protein